MGAADDAMAVIDPEGRARGLAGLRLAGASILPAVSCANARIPTLTTPETIAERMRRPG